MPTAVNVSSNQIVHAKQHIADAIARSDSYVEGLTESGVLMHVLIDLGIVLDVSLPNGD